MYQHTPCSTSARNWSTTDCILQLLMTELSTPDGGSATTVCRTRINKKAATTKPRIRAEYFKLLDNVTRCGSSWYLLIACFIRLNYLHIPQLL